MYRIIHSQELRAGPLIRAAPLIAILLLFSMLSPSAAFAATTWDYGITDTDYTMIDQTKTDSFVNNDGNKVTLHKTLPRAVSFNENSDYIYSSITATGFKSFKFDSNRMKEINSTSVTSLIKPRYIANGNVYDWNNNTLIHYAYNGTQMLPISSLGLTSIKEAKSIDSRGYDVAVLFSTSLDYYGFNENKMVKINKLSITGLRNAVDVALMPGGMAVLDDNKIKYYQDGNLMSSTPVANAVSIAANYDGLSVITGKQIKHYELSGGSLTETPSFAVNTGLNEPRSLDIHPKSHDLIVLDEGQIKYFAYDGNQMKQINCLSTTVSGLDKYYFYNKQEFLQSNVLADITKPIIEMRVRAKCTVPDKTTITWQVTNDDNNGDGTWYDVWRVKGYGTNQILELKQDGSWNNAGTASQAYPEADNVDLNYVFPTPGIGVKWKAILATTDSAVTPEIAASNGVAVRVDVKEGGDGFSLTVNTVGPGTVTKDPDKPLYKAGDKVTLTAAPTGTATFEGWSGDASGNDLTTTVTMDDNKSVTASFNSESEPPPEGSGDIVFTPDSTAGKTPRGWARENVPVVVTIPGYEPQKVGGQKTWTYKIENYFAAKKTWVDGGTGTAEYNYKQNWSLSPTPIQVTGAVTQKVAIGGSVTITTESATQNLVGNVAVTDWKKGSFEGDKPTLPQSNSTTRYTWINQPEATDTPPPDKTYSGTSGVYKIDKTKIEKVVFNPNQTISSPGPGAVENWSNAPVNVNMSVKDNLSGIYPAGTKYTVTNSSISSPLGNTTANFSGGEGILTSSVLEVLNQNGVFKINTTSEDWAGWTNTSVSGEYKIDLVTPTIAFSMEERPWHFGDYVSKQPVDVMVTVADNLSGVQTFKYQWTNTSAMLNWDSPGWITTIPVSQNLRQTGEGIWWLHVIIADKAGNRTYHRSNGPYKIDLTAPSPNINDLPYWLWTNVPYTIQLKFDDPLITPGPTPGGDDPSLLDSSWWIENMSYYPYLPNPSSGTIQRVRIAVVYITINQDGEYRLHVTWKDGAGNTITSIYPPPGNPDAWHDKYLFDSTPPYDTTYAPADGVARNIITSAGILPVFDYVANYQNQIRVTVGDNLSGIGPKSGTNKDYFWYSWSKSRTSLTEGNWIVVNGINTQEIFAKPYTQKQEGVDIRTFNINIHSTGTYDSVSPNYAGLKEGLWYLHIKTKDRAGNVTSTLPLETADAVSGANPSYFKQIAPQAVFINKLNSLRVNNITDPKWKSTFTTPSGGSTALKTNGIRVTDMPIYSNKEYNTIKLGYQVHYKINAVGFSDPNDMITARVQYHVLDQKNLLYRDVDVYVPNKNGKYIKLADSSYSNEAYIVRLKPAGGIGFMKPYEPASNPDNLVLYNRDGAQNQYSTYITYIYLPPTAKFASKGAVFDPVKGKDLHNYKVLVTFDISAERRNPNTGGHVDLDYTMLEDTWARIDRWINGMNDYGKNRPTGQDVLGKGVNHGEIFWYNLEQTLQDDLKFYRRW